MKKLLLIGAIAGCFTLSAAADTAPALRVPDRSTTPRLDVAGNLPQLPSASAARSRAAGDTEGPVKEMCWGYTTQVYNATSLNGEVSSLSVAIQMPPEESTIMAGNKITHIQYPTGSAAETISQLATDATVWVSESLDGERLSAKSVSFAANPGEFNDFTLDNPVEIQAGKSYYIGVTFSGPTLTQKAYPIVFSFAQPFTDYGCYIGYVSGSGSDWMESGDQIGYLPLLAILEGDNLPQNMLRVYGLEVPSMASMGTPFAGNLLVANGGAASIASFGIQAWTEGTEAPAAAEITVNGDFGPYPDVMVLPLDNLEATAVGDGTFNVSIPTVNGEPNTLTTQTSASAGQLVLAAGSGYRRATVFEDATGTWCGWCPLAHYFMEQLREGYTDRGFIGIAVHGSNGNSVDPMDVMSGSLAPYAGIGNYISGFPTILMNRESQFNTGNTLDQLIAAVEDNYANALSPVNVEADIELDPDNTKRITINTRTTTASDFTGTRYKLSFVPTEDLVGPYSQANYYSGEPTSAGGFEKEPNPCVLMYNDVARGCYTFSGVKNSLPEELKAGETYEFSYKISISKVSNLDHYAVTVLVIDQKTGVIANACRVYSPTYNGVRDVVVDADNTTFTVRDGAIYADNNAAVEVYNLSGQRMPNSNLSAGLYIARANGINAKVLVK